MGAESWARVVLVDVVVTNGHGVKRGCRVGEGTEGTHEWRDMHGRHGLVPWVDARVLRLSQARCSW